jgi:hypothetical protein
LSERGFIAIARGYLDHEAFASEPFTEREAFQWLIMEASWKDRTVRRGFAVFDTKRGELIHALSFMCEAWGWDNKSRVTRFLARLQKLEMIETRAERSATRITICNYDKYQLGRDEDRNDKRDASGTQPLRQTNELEEITITKQKTNSAGERFDDFWKAYPRRDGANPKEPARKLFLQAVKAGANPEAIIAGARRCAEKESKNVGTPYIPQAVKWLRDRRWEDYNAAAITEIPSKETQEKSWRFALEYQASKETWDLRSPEPGSRDCKIPKDFIEQWKASRLQTQGTPT